MTEKVTKFQAKGIRASLTDEYNSLKSKFDNNPDNALYNVYALSMRSWKSHEERVVGMSQEIGKYNLNSTQKSALESYLITYKDNVVRNAKRIKNVNKIVSVTDSLSGFLHQETENPNIQIQNYQTATKKKAGFGLKETLISIAGVAAIGIGLWTTYNIGNKNGKVSQQPLIIQQKAEIDKAVETLKGYEKVIDYSTQKITAQRQLLDSAEKIILNGFSEKKDLENKLRVAGRPDAEVKKEAVEETTKTLTAQYEKQIESVRQEVKAQIQELAKQQEDSNNIIVYENKSVDNIENVQNIKPRECPDKPNILSSTGYALKDGVSYLGNGVKAAGNGIIGVFKNKKAGNLDSNSVGPLENKVETTTQGSNTVWEDRMSMLGPRKSTWRGPELDCLCEDIYKEMNFQEQQYLIDANAPDAPFAYANRVGNKAKKLSQEKNHLGSAAARIGQGFAIVNSVVGVPVTWASESGGALWGIGSNTIGNKWDGADNGWKNGRKFAKFFMDGLPGGETKDTVDYYLLSGHWKKAIATPYCMENTKLGGHAKLGEVAASNFFSFKWFFDMFKGGHGHGGHSGGLTRDGGEVSSGINSSGGVVR
ncbi:MAG: hypothetical protein WCX73_01160 [Candidatus Pacearchaeota archaeon]|jgi:hypothetical protein